MKNTKTLILLLVAGIMLATAASASTTILSKANELRIDLLRIDPSPLQPGKTSDLVFEITNLKDKDLNNFEVKLVDGTPNLIDSGDKTLNFGKLASGEKIQFKFPIIPKQDIPDGEYSLSIQYFSDEIDSITSQTFQVKVRRVNRDVAVTSTKVNPLDKLDAGMLLPGKPAQLTLSFHNPSEYTLRDITLTLELESSSIPIAPLGTTSEAKIRTLAPGGTKDITFNLIALPDATANVYKIPLTIKYFDEIGDNHSRSDLVGVIIDGSPEIHVEIKDNTLYDSFGVGEVTIDFVNKGLSKIKFLTVQLNEPTEEIWLLGKEYKILSEDKLYLGDVDPDDDEGADFTIRTKSLDGTITLPITIEFRDANNELHTQSFDIDIDLHSKKELGLEKSSYIMNILLLLAVLIFLLKYRKWKKANKQKGLIDYLRFLVSKLRRK